MRFAKFLLFIGLVLSACKKQKDHAPPFTGAPTFERIEKARTLVNLGDDWNDARATVEAEAGAPLAQTATRAMWGLSTNDACIQFEIEKSAKGDHIGTIAGGKKFNRAEFTDSPESTFAECVAAVQAKR